MGRRVNLRGPAGKLTHNVIKERKESKRESQRSGAEKCKECAEKQWEFILANRKLMSSLFFRLPLRTPQGGIEMNPFLLVLSRQSRNQTG